MYQPTVSAKRRDKSGYIRWMCPQIAESASHCPWPDIPTSQRELKINIDRVNPTYKQAGKRSTPTVKTHEPQPSKHRRRPKKPVSACAQRPGHTMPTARATSAQSLFTAPGIHFARRHLTESAFSTDHCGRTACLHNPHCHRRRIPADHTCAHRPKRQAIR